MRILALFVGFAIVGGVSAAEEVWRLDEVNNIGGHIAAVEGAPKAAKLEMGTAIVFDGVKDGVFVPGIPFAGAKQWTIEILFRPAEGGPKEQRFFHAQDAKGARAMLETRLDGKGNWWLDSYITSSPSGGGVALIDPKRVHPTDRWYWAALRYDGKVMAHFVNGRKELEREGKFEPFDAGRISLGMRQNKIYWFKGAIREVRFHPEAVADEKLQRIDDPASAGRR